MADAGEGRDARGNSNLELKWALVLGSSSGFGAATSAALAEEAGLNVCGVAPAPAQRPGRL